MNIGQIRVLLVYPQTPVSFHGGQYANAALGIRANIPPLPLLTVAALLPDNYVCRLLDMNVQKLTVKDIDWADVVFVSGMVAQRKSFAEVIDFVKARSPQKLVVAGGPFPTAMPNAGELVRADAVFLGEAEDVKTWTAFLRDLEAGQLKREYCAEKFPDVRLSPTPRYDLIPRRGAYFGLAVQWSRGCPHTCDFCDVAELYGQSRYKTPEQAVRDLDAILATGFRGTVFIADDNLTGKIKHARALLERVRDWQIEHGSPLVFYTQVSVLLAEDEETMDLMLAAGVRSIFVGLETSSEAAHRETGKRQNVGRDLAEVCRTLRQKGFWVQAGYMIGFLSDDVGSFAAMEEFVGKTAVPEALVGLVTAPVGTPLWRKSLAEGRLRSGATGDTYGTNLNPERMTYQELLLGYRKMMKRLFRPGRYFRRASEALRQLSNRSSPAVRRRVTWRELRALVWSLVRQGFLSSYAWHYWLFIIRNFRRGKFGLAVGLAIRLYHFRLYFRRHVFPRLNEELKT